jgi:hypothetical protein
MVVEDALLVAHDHVLIRIRDVDDATACAKTLKNESAALF